jgi:hypothetical protein
VTGEPEITGGRLAGAATVTENGASDADVVPSETEMTMPE